jgi:hypothetical protein
VRIQILIKPTINQTNDQSIKQSIKPTINQLSNQKNKRTSISTVPHQDIAQQSTTQNTTQWDLKIQTLHFQYYGLRYL